MNVKELVAGNQVLGWMKLGLALLPTRAKDGGLQYTVPTKLRRATAGTLTAFTGIVVSNDIVNHVLSLHVAPMNSDLRAFNVPTSHIVSLHYTALRRMRLLSEYSFPAREETGSPTKKAAFNGTAFKPYRTLTEVELV